MKFFPKADQRHLHNIMLPSIAIIFIASNYVIFIDVGPILKWNISFYRLYVLILLGFSISWVYAGAINKEYKKSEAVVTETDAAQTVLQAKLTSLSRKEREVLQHILQSKSNQQICDELHISLSTLKTHITNIYRKMQVSRRQEIMVLFG